MSLSIVCTELARGSRCALESISTLSEQGTLTTASSTLSVIPWKGAVAFSVGSLAALYMTKSLMKPPLRDARAAIDEPPSPTQLISPEIKKLNIRPFCCDKSGRNEEVLLSHQKEGIDVPSPEQVGKWLEMHMSITPKG